MASEPLIQATMAQFAPIPKDRRENLLTALLASKLAKEVDGVDLVMDPRHAQMIQPIVDDPVALEAAIEALSRLNQAESKKAGVFGRLFGRK